MNIEKLTIEATKNQTFAGGIHEQKVAEIYFRRGFKTHQEITKDKVFSLDDVKKIMKWVGRNYSEVEDELAKPFEDRGEDLDDNFFDDVYQEALKRAIDSL